MINPYIKTFLKTKFIKNFNKKGIANFHDFDAGYFHKLLNSRNPKFWEREGEKMALCLFSLASRNVPAYKDFLKKNKINPEKIKTIKDFKYVPITDKNNYIKKYPLEDLCWKGKLAGNSIISVSSGSSGVPSFWPRGDDLELETSIVLEMISKTIFEADKNSTLFIDGFSMGIYIAGVVILDAALRTAEKKYPISIMSPGINKDDILRIVKEVGDKFNQVIISGYPPFVKDIIDQGETEKLNWKKYNVKFLFAAEKFSEDWRNYMIKKSGSKDALKSSVNIYGTADASILAHETPISILLRKLALKNFKLHANLFGRTDILPTFAQYNPVLKYFENYGKELLFSSFAGIPLIRYRIHDFGGIKCFDEVMDMFQQKERNDIEREIGRNKIWKLPFVYVFCKSDKTVSLYGLNIYPEHIKTALEHKSLEKSVTGKFLMETKNKSNQDQYLEINIEFKYNAASDKNTANKIEKIIIKTLRKLNLEYNCLCQSIGKKADPEIKLWPKSHPKYFDEKVIKQKWSKA